MEASPRSLVLTDGRGGERYLRVSWHPETRTIVLSHWSGGVCTASTRLALQDGTQLIGFLVAALQHAATFPMPSRRGGEATVRSVLNRAAKALHRRWARHMAPIVPFEVGGNVTTVAPYQTAVNGRGKTRAGGTEAT